MSRRPTVARSVAASARAAPIDLAFPLRAGDGNRTRVASLEDWGSTIELRPRAPRPARHRTSERHPRSVPVPRPPRASPGHRPNTHSHRHRPPHNVPRPTAAGLHSTRSRAVAQFGSAPRLGRGGRRFKSGQPDEAAYPRRRWGGFAVARYFFRGRPPEPPLFASLTPSCRSPRLRHRPSSPSLLAFGIALPRLRHRLSLARLWLCVRSGCGFLWVRWGGGGRRLVLGLWRCSGRVRLGAMVLGGGFGLGLRRRLRTRLWRGR